MVWLLYTIGLFKAQSLCQKIHTTTAVTLNAVFMVWITGTDRLSSCESNKRSATILLPKDPLFAFPKQTEMKAVSTSGVEFSHSDYKPHFLSTRLLQNLVEIKPWQKYLCVPWEQHIDVLFASWSLGISSWCLAAPTLGEVLFYDDVTQNDVKGMWLWEDWVGPGHLCKSLKRWPLSVSETVKPFDVCVVWCIGQTWHHSSLYMRSAQV